MYSFMKAGAVDPSLIIFLGLEIIVVISVLYFVVNKIWRIIKKKTI